MTAQIITNCEILAANVTMIDNSVISISGLISGISISQSIESSAYHGTITVVDTVGIIENRNNPFRGEERMQLVLRGMDTNVTKKLDTFIHKIDNVSVMDNNDGARYTLHFVSFISYKSSLRKIITSFDQPVSDTVKDIFNEYFETISRESRPSDVGASPSESVLSGDDMLNAKFYKINQDVGLLIENTEGDFRCIIPNYNPSQAMYFLSSRAYSTESPSCSFKFFETMDGFRFVTDEYLIKYANSNNSQRIFTYKSTTSKRLDQLEDQIINIEQLENEKRVDTGRDIVSGAYTNIVYVLDITNKTVEERKFNYATDGKEKFMKMEKVRETNSEVHSDTFMNAVFTDENAKRFTIIKDYDSNNSIQLRGEQYLPEIISNKISYNHHINNTVVSATIQGRLDIQAGDIAKVYVTEFISTNDRKINPHLSGNYIVHSVNHEINGKTLTTNMKLIKYGWST